MKKVGFFLCFHENLPVIEQPSLTSDAEAICYIRSICICTFYQPPNVSTDSLQSNLQHLQQSELSPNITIGEVTSTYKVAMKWLDNGALLD